MRRLRPVKAASPCTSRATGIKTQRGAALSAVQDGEGSRLGMEFPRPWTRASRLQLLHQGSQGGKAPAGGLDVLRVRQTGDGADPAAEGGGDQARWAWDLLGAG